MLRERKRQIGVDALDAVLTSAPTVFYGFYLLTKPDDDFGVYAGLIAVAASLAVKLILVAIRRPTIWVRANDEARQSHWTKPIGRRWCIGLIAEPLPPPERGSTQSGRAPGTKDRLRPRCPPASLFGVCGCDGYVAALVRQRGPSSWPIGWQQERLQAA